MQIMLSFIATVERPQRQIAEQSLYAVLVLTINQSALHFEMLLVNVKSAVF